MLSPHPTVEVASAALQQEEAQREVVHPYKTDSDASAMYSRSFTDKTQLYSACGGKGHSGDR